MEKKVEPIPVKLKRRTSPRKHVVPTHGVPLDLFPDTPVPVRTRLREEPTLPPQ
jgi:hypothetical protein